MIDVQFLKSRQDLSRFRRPFQLALRQFNVGIIYKIEKFVVHCLYKYMFIIVLMLMARKLLKWLLADIANQAAAELFLSNQY